MGHGEGEEEGEGGNSYLRLLFVDDESMILDFFKREFAEHRISLARSGREAIEILKTSEFNLIFCDLMMPDQTGMDVHDYLCIENRGREELMVFMSGGTWCPRAEEFVARVPNRFLRKPFGMRALYDCINELTKRDC